MADDPSNTKPDPCSLDEADWVSATELGEIIVQINHGAWVLAYVDIREALLGGCGAVLELELNGQKSYVFPPPGFWLPPDRLRWVNGLNPSMRREDYPDRPWPWELRAYLLSSEREGFDATARIFLRRVEAAQWGLPLESPQAVASEEPPPPREQPGEPTVGSVGKLLPRLPPSRTRRRPRRMRKRRPPNLPRFSSPTRKCGARSRPRIQKATRASRRPKWLRHLPSMR